MATVTGFTADRMQEIEDSAIVGGEIVDGDLILTRRDDGEINAGSVAGPAGPDGPPGPTSIQIVTSGTRPPTPAEGDYIHETDTDRLYYWNGTAWVYRGGLVICTSGTHPASPFEGLEIYETDTDKRLIYNGVRFDPPWKMPWGVMGFVANSTVQNGLSTADTDLTGLTTGALTYVANRLIRIKGIVTLGNNSVLSTYRLKLKEGAAVLKTAVMSEDQLGHEHWVEHYITPTAGAHTYKLAVSSDAGTFDRFGPGLIVVEDIGPNGVPA